MPAPKPVGRPASGKDLWEFGRSDRWGLVVLLGLVSLGALVVHVVLPAVDWMFNRPLTVPFVSEVGVPTLDRLGVSYSEADYQLLLQDPAAYLRLLDVLPGLVWLALIVIGCVLLLRVLDDIGGGEPFQLVNVRRLRIVAGLLAIGWPLAILVESVATLMIQVELDLGDLGASAILPVPLVPLLSGLLVALLAEAFKAGSRLSDDVDGLI